MIIEKSDIIEWLSGECMDLTFEDWLEFIQAGTRFSSDEGELVVRLAQYYRIKGVVDSIEPVPDYDQWIADKVPVIGWIESIDKCWSFRIGILDRYDSLGNGGKEFYLVSCDLRTTYLYPNCCLYTPEAWERLKKGERPNR